MQLEKVISRCKKQERKAQFELYEWGYSIMMSMAYRYKKNKDDAAALVNTAFFKVLTNIDKYNVDQSFEGWMKRIMANTIIDEYRKEKNNVLSFIDNDSIIEESDKYVDYNLIERQLELEDVEQIMASIGEQEALIFNLFEIDGYSHKEIAKMLGISDRTSKRYLAKAKKELLQVVNIKLNKHKLAV